jgi:ketosteroid isomerase-like protein
VTAPADSPAAAVGAYLDAFNRGDAAALAACFAERGVILDGMAPHLWTGPSAAADWYRDVLAEGEHLGASGYRVTLGEPAHDVATGDSAYFVAPARMGVMIGGTPALQTGATLTFALKREKGAWRIAGWAWSKGQFA